MPKTVKCPNCGCEFEKELQDRGLSYSEVMKQVEALLEAGQFKDTELVSRQCGRPRLEISEMIAKIRKRRPDKILRSVRQGEFKFLSDPEEIAKTADKRLRHLWGQHRLYAQDRTTQVALLEQTGEPEKLQRARDIRETYHIVGDLLPEPVRAKRLPSGFFEVISGNGERVIY